MRTGDLVGVLTSCASRWVRWIAQRALKGLACSPTECCREMAARNEDASDVRTPLLPIRGGEIDEPFQSWIEETPAAYVVHVKGEVDALNTPKLRAYLEEAAGGGRHIIVDLSAVTFLDLNGLRLLETYHHRCRDRGRRLVVIAVSQMPRRIMDIVEFTREIPVVQSRQAAEDLLSS